MSNEKKVLMKIEHLTKEFEIKSKKLGGKPQILHALNDVSVDIYEGETLGVIGESGCGKSTFGRTLIQLHKATAGSVTFDGKDLFSLKGAELKKAKKDVQMVFQDPAASQNERATVDYIISEGLYNFHLFENEADRVRKVEDIIQEVGLLPEHLTRYPHEFSGGQRQRIGLARAMVMDPELVVADEPISALDVSIRAQVLNLLKKFQRERGTTYLFIAHDLSIVRFISDRIGVIYKGDIVEVATAEELFDFPMHPYTRSLISAIPIPDPNLEKHKVLFSYDPSQHDYSEDKPELTDIGHGHFVFGNKKEIEEYKRLREEGTPIKSVTIAGVNAPADAKTVEKQLEEKKIEGSILDTPLHDTGSFWLAFLSFFLAIPGLIAGAIFKKHNYIRNYKKCKKGAIAGLITTAAIIVLFGLMLIISIL